MGCPKVRTLSRALGMFVIVAAVCLYGATPLLAQHGGVPDQAALARAYERAQAEARQREAIETNRASFVARLLDPWRAQLRDGGAEVEELLLSASVERLLAASQAATWDALLSAAFNREVTGNAMRDPGTNLVFGDADTDLVFFPVTPCRLFDTRLAVGALSPGVVRTFGVNGAPGSPGNLSPQGGAASDCGVPVDPAAVAVTLAAVTPSGAGNIRAWAAGGAVPTASAINYSTALPALANTTIIPVCMGCGTGIDIDLRSDASTVHAVGDVVGYFWFPNGLPTTRRAEFDFVSVLGDGTVASLASSTFTPSRTGNAVVEATGYCNIDQTGTTHGIGIGLSAAPAGGDPSRTVFMRVQAADAPGLHQHGWAVTDFVAVTAGVSATITLRGQQFFGTAGVNEDCSGTMLVREAF